MSEQMVEFVLDFLSENDQQIFSQQEQNVITEGIKRWLKDYGVPCDGSDPFFYSFVGRLLEKIEIQDLKDFFLYYNDIHSIREELQNHADKPNDLPPESRSNCISALGRLVERPALLKYVPLKELRQKHIRL